AYLGVVLLGFIFLFIQTYATEYTGQRAMHDLRMEVFSHLQKQDMAYFDRNPVGRLMTRTINDVETLNELFSTGVVGLLEDMCIVFGIAMAMLWLDWKLALVCLSAFPLILYISRFYRRRAREVYRESRLVLARLNAGLQENIAGIGTIQTLIPARAAQHDDFVPIPLECARENRSEVSRASRDYDPEPVLIPL